MSLKIKRLQDFEVRGKRTLVRVDYNVPMTGDGAVADSVRIRESLKTVRYLLDGGARVVLISHLGRPDGKVNGKYTLKPVAEELGRLLKCKVRFGSDCVGEEARSVVDSLKDGEVALLENLRFHPEEEANEAGFAESLSRYGELFIQEAFGTLHRAHASTAGIPRHLPGAIGFLVQKELEFLDRTLSNPKRPFVAILGGSKVSDKLGVIHRLLDRVDGLLIGGAMSYTFLAAQGMSVGKSKVEPDRIEEVKSIVEKAFNKGVQCLLPADHVAVQEVKAGADSQITQGMAIPPDWIGVDIGPHTVRFFTEEMRSAKTIFWNGPLGIFEMEPFDQGSLQIAKALALATAKGATTIAGGGDSLALLNRAGVLEKVTHCSTGGGASLELIEGKTLPGLAALNA